MAARKTKTTPEVPEADTVTVEEPQDTGTVEAVEAGTGEAVEAAGSFEAETLAPAPVEDEGRVFPTAFPKGWVAGRWLDTTGRPMNGTVTFWLSHSRMRAAGSGATVIGSKTTVKLVDGLFDHPNAVEVTVSGERYRAIPVPAVGAPGVVPAGLKLNVEEVFVGGVSSRYSPTVTTAHTQAAPLVLTAQDWPLATMPDVINLPVVGPQGPAGPAGPKGDKGDALIIRETVNGSALYYMDGAVKRLITGSGATKSLSGPAFQNGFTAAGGVNLRREGTMVTCDVIQGSITATTLHNFIDIPTGFKPVGTNYTTVGGRLVYTSNGGVTAGAGAAVTNQYFTLRWATNDPWPPSASSRDEDGDGDGDGDGGASPDQEQETTVRVAPRATRSRKLKPTEQDAS